MESKTYRYFIGIDPGMKTGFALWDKKEKKFLSVESMKIHEAMLQITALSKDELSITMIRFEDARLRKWFGNAGREHLQGAGSIKRDCTIWEDFLTDLKANFEMVAPKSNKTKLNSAIFKQMTKWEHPTNEHARDGAMLVFGI